MHSAFPDFAHREALRQLFLTNKHDLTKFNDDELWMWHAYDYGGRRVMLGDWTHPAGYDRTGEWFNEAMAAKAEAMWRRKLKLSQEKPQARPRAREEAAAARQRFAEEHGLPDFAAVMAVGINNVSHQGARARGSFKPLGSAREIPPPGRPKPAYVEMSPEEVLASLERLSGEG